VRRVLILFGLSLAWPAVAAPPVPILPNRDDRDLLEHLDQIVGEAEKLARPRLGKKVMTAEEALAIAPVPHDRIDYVVYEYRGWFIVVWQGVGDKPAFWLSTVAIRKGSNEAHRSGSW
jgi:hypothetical protein